MLPALADPSEESSLSDVPPLDVPVEVPLLPESLLPALPFSATPTMRSTDSSDMIGEQAAIASIAMNMKNKNVFFISDSPSEMVFGLVNLFC